MKKQHIQTTLEFLLLISIILSSGCAPSSVIDSPTATSQPMQTPTLQITLTTVSMISTLPTVTPIFTKIAATPVYPKESVSTSGHYSVPSQQPDSECLPPLLNFGFPVGRLDDLGNVIRHPMTLPPSYWQVQTSLPDDFGFYAAENIITLDNGDLWIEGTTSQFHGAETAYFIYRPNQKSEIYLEESYRKNDPFYVPEKLLKMKDGTLWGIGTQYLRRYSMKPLISRYNEITGLFEYVEDQDNIFHDLTNKQSWIIATKLDSFGKIWILIDQKKFALHQDDKSTNKVLPSGLYRFDPVTRKADYFLAQAADFYFHDFFILPDGSIWLSNSDNKQAPLWRYFPNTGELKPYKGTFSYAGRDDFLDNPSPGYRNFFLDSNNQLWIDDKGWLTKPESEWPSWYRIIRSPIFINAYHDGDANFYWSNPDGMSESSDGMLWFWADVGTVRLNPNTGEWCLFTTYSSPVVEDKDHNLWMVADNKLYKYKLGK